MDSIVHFEIPADDMKRAENFYTRAFGWNANQVPNFEYTMFGTVSSDQNGAPTVPGAINGGMPKRGKPVEHVVVTIKVDDIDSSLEKIERLGGKTVQKKMPIGDMGFTAYFKDTEGNTIGLFQTPQM